MGKSGGDYFTEGQRFESEGDERKAVRMYMRAMKKYESSYDVNRVIERLKKIGYPKKAQKGLKRLADINQKKKKVGFKLGHLVKEGPDFHGFIGRVILGIFIGLAIFFLSPNVTGYTIANLTKANSTWIGSVFLVLGIIAVFFYLRKSENK